MKPREYRVAADLRRCCWYVIAATPPLIALMIPIHLWVQGRRPVEVAATSCVLLMAAACFFLPLLWRLRVDERGLSRRVLGTTAFWSWEEFERGVIEKRPDGSLVHTGWAWWNPRRRLTLTLEPDDRKEVLAAINSHFRLPEAPGSPGSLSLRNGFTRVMLDANGVRVEGGRGQGAFLWSEVEAVDLQRSDPMRHDFRRMRLILPGRVLDFRLHRGSPTWRGADADVISTLVARSVPPDRFLVAIDGEPLTSREQVALRAAEAERNAREFFGATVVLGLAVAVFLAWLAWRDGLTKTALMAALMAPPVGAPYAWINFSLRRTSAAWQRLLVGDAWRSEPPPDGVL